MTTSKKQNIVYLLTLLCFTFFIVSCKKESNKYEVGQATLNVTLIGVESDVDNPEGDNSISKEASNSSLGEQPSIVEIPLDKNLSAYISLEEEITQNSKTSAIKNKLAAKEVGDLVIGVKYGILVYDQAGALVSQKEFTYGSEGTTTPFALDGGKTYTFIGYSNNTAVLPSPSNINQLSTAAFNNVTGDLLYFRHVQTVVTGNNNLRVMLRHKFTHITTELKIGTTYKGSINAVSSGSFTNLRQNGSIKLSDSSMTYSSTVATQAITFPAITTPVTTISSTPNIIIAPNADGATSFQIPTLTVNNVVYTIPQTTFVLKAAKKYKLVVTLNAPCYTGQFYISNRTTPGGGLINYVDSISTTLRFKDKTTRPVINFHLIDNNFNIIVNNKPLFEARFQTTTVVRQRSRFSASSGWIPWSIQSTSGPSGWGNWAAYDVDFSPTSTNNTRSIAFNDGTFWGNGTIPEIYLISGTQANPTVKVTFNADGSSSITGKKSDGGTQVNLAIVANPAYPILTADNVMNPVYNPQVTILASTSTLERQSIIVRSAMNFRKNIIPYNAPTVSDVIRIRASTRHMLPQATHSFTDLNGSFTPLAGIVCPN